MIVGCRCILHFAAAQVRVKLHDNIAYYVMPYLPMRLIVCVCVCVCVSLCVFLCVRTHGRELPAQQGEEPADVAEGMCVCVRACGHGRELPPQQCEEWADAC